MATTTVLRRHRAVPAVLFAFWASAATFGQSGQTEGEHVTTSPPIGGQGSFDVPADCDMAVGLSYVVVVDNSEIHVYSKADFDPANAPSWAEQYDMRGAYAFFGELFQAPETAVVFDPQGRVRHVR